MDGKKVIDEINSLDEDSDFIIKSNKKGINVGTIFLIILIIILIAGVYLYSTKDKRLAQEALTDFGKYLSENPDYFYNEDLDYEVISEDEDNFEEESKNLKIIKEFQDVNKNLGIILNNQNKNTVTGILVQVIFYNNENKPIKINDYVINILEPNLDYYIIFNETPENFERYEFLITKEYEDPSIKSLKNSITYDVKDKNGNEIVITGENSSSETIKELEFFLIYYDENNNILGVDTIYEYDIDKNNKFKIESYKGMYDDNYEEINYERYEVVLASAYTYEY